MSSTTCKKTRLVAYKRREKTLYQWCSFTQVVFKTRCQAFPRKPLTRFAELSKLTSTRNSWKQLLKIMSLKKCRKEPIGQESQQNLIPNKPAVMTLTESKNRPIKLWSSLLKRWSKEKSCRIRNVKVKLFRCKSGYLHQQASFFGCLELLFIL